MLDRLLEVTASPWGAYSPPVALCHVKPGRVAVAWAARLPFADGVFDAVLAQHILCRADGGIPTLREMARVLRPDGCLIGLETVQNARGLAPALGAAGLALVHREPFDLLAYPGALALGALPVLAYAYPAHVLLQALFALDGLLMRVPAVQAYSWHTIFVARKHNVRTSDA